MVGKRYQESQVSGNVARKKGQGIDYTVREREGGARKVEQTEQGAELLLPVGYSQNGYSKKGNLRHHYTEDYKSIQFPRILGNYAHAQTVGTRRSFFHSHRMPGYEASMHTAILV